MTQEIPLTQGQVAIVCDCHSHLIDSKKWCASWDPTKKQFVAVRGATVMERLLGSPLTIYMHVVIHGTPKGLQTDHINNNSLDNRCENLRTATNAENQRNRAKYSNNKSGYRGVIWNKQRGKWMAQIRLSNGQSKYLKLFSDAEQAARAYDRAAIQSHGEFASLNFPRSDYE